MTVSCYQHVQIQGPKPSTHCHIGSSCSVNPSIHVIHYVVSVLNPKHILIYPVFHYITLCACLVSKVAQPSLSCRSVWGLVVCFGLWFLFVFLAFLTSCRFYSGLTLLFPESDHRYILLNILLRVYIPSHHSVTCKYV